MAATFKPRPRALQQVREAAAYGVLNACFAIESSGKEHAPVRGGHRSYDPEGPVGGFLRRSIHSVVFLDGKRIAGPATDQNGNSLDGYAPEAGIVGYVGTNADYAIYVHEGTYKMPARPFLMEAFLEHKDEIPALVAAGARRRLERA